MYVDIAFYIIIVLLKTGIDYFNYSRLINNYSDYCGKHLDFKETRCNALGNPNI